MPVDKLLHDFLDLFLIKNQLVKQLTSTLVSYLGVCPPDIRSHSLHFYSQSTYISHTSQYLIFRSACYYINQIDMHILKFLLPKMFYREYRL